MHPSRWVPFAVSEINLLHQAPGEKCPHPHPAPGPGAAEPSGLEGREEAGEEEGGGEERVGVGLEEEGDWRGRLVAQSWSDTARHRSPSRAGRLSRAGGSAGPASCQRAWPT